MPHTLPEPLGLYAQLACIWEATARKPGNVHRFADFADSSYLDFLMSAAALAPVFDRAPELSVGEIVLGAIEQARAVVRTNTHLGIVLLLAPLAKTTPARPINEVLDALTVHDAELVYEAIRLAAPAGLGKVAEQDISTRPTQTLREVMALAADRDLVARQYVTNFHEVYHLGVGTLRDGFQRFGALEPAIIVCVLWFLASLHDSLIVRKCGAAIAEEASVWATTLLDIDFLRDPAGADRLRNFDRWLRADGHRRNPGTTADLVAACLFVALREGIITLPPQYPWSLGGAGLPKNGPQS
jgi:triphosphoribosyl-dephospho-CoA synthase